MDLYAVVKFLHVMAGIWLVTGIAGRAVVLGQAGRSTDIATVRTLVPLVGRFESLMVRPASFVVLLMGLVAAWMQGWPLLGFLPRGKVFGQALQSASSSGSVTPELTAAFNDSAVRNAHIVEGALLVIILYLMVAKPF